MNVQQNSMYERKSQGRSSLMKELELIGRVGYESGLANPNRNGDGIDEDTNRVHEAMVTNHLAEEQRKKQ